MLNADQRLKALNVLKRVLGSPIGSDFVGGIAGGLFGQAVANSYNYLMPGENLDINPDITLGIGFGLGSVMGGSLIRRAMSNYAPVTQRRNRRRY